MARDDFDFFHGAWTIHNRRLKERLKGSQDWAEFGAACICRPMSAGMGFVDEITLPSLGTNGANIGLYEAEDDRWAHYWASSVDGVLQPPIYGRRIRPGLLEFTAVEEQEGQTVDVRALWTVDSADVFHWEQAFRQPGGSWETNWYMTFTRSGQAP
jgi:hypothetical protein